MNVIIGIIMARTKEAVIEELDFGGRIITVKSKRVVIRERGETRELVIPRQTSWRGSNFHQLLSSSRAVVARPSKDDRRFPFAESFLNIIE